MVWSGAVEELSEPLGVTRRVSWRLQPPLELYTLL